MFCLECGEYSLSAAASRELAKRIASSYAEVNRLLRSGGIFE